jgi:glycerophosphoryl diester phosphodiesterase
MSFVNYAHRGASEYLPENTLLAFYTGLYMGANGIETDIQKTKDNVLALFHDDTLARVTGEAGSIQDYTFAQLQEFSVKKNGFTDKIVAFEDFLQKFSFRDITFAIELKGAGVEAATADLLRKYHMESKTVVTSFHLDYLETFRRYAPEFQIGYLAEEINDALLAKLHALGAEELCPEAQTMTPEKVSAWHRAGFRVRAWGVYNEALMCHACACGADGMTVNFPDKLTDYLTTHR